jgi:hypothetical protein
MGARILARLVSTADLKAMLGDGGELALLDLREELPFSERHLLWARSLPLGRIELRLAALVPRRATRIVLCDAGEGFAECGAAKLAAWGYARGRDRRLGARRLRPVLRRQRAEQGVRRIHRACQRHAQHRPRGIAAPARRGARSGHRRQPAL